MLRNWCFLHLHTSRCYATDVSCTCTHLDATQLMFLALAHISMLRNWCFLPLHTSRCYATDVSCSCTHLDATQLMFLALAHISVLRNWCFLHVHTSGCYATDVPGTCTHLGATQLMFFAIAHISVLRNWCSLHLHTSRCDATDLFRNRMHQSNSTKQHAWQIVSNGDAVNYRRLLIFPPDLATKTDVWTLSKHSMINCIWKHDMQSTSEKTHFIWKNTVKSTPWLQEQQTAADTQHM